MSIRITNESPNQKIKVGDMKVGETVYGYVLFSAERRQMNEPRLYMRTWADTDRYCLVDLSDGNCWRGITDATIPLTIEGRLCNLDISVVEA